MTTQIIFKHAHTHESVAYTAGQVVTLADDDARHLVISGHAALGDGPAVTQDTYADRTTTIGPANTLQSMWYGDDSYYQDWEWTCPESGLYMLESPEPAPGTNGDRVDIGSYLFPAAGPFGNPIGEYDDDAFLLVAGITYTLSFVHWAPGGCQGDEWLIPAPKPAKGLSLAPYSMGSLVVAGQRANPSLKGSYGVAIGSFAQENVTGGANNIAVGNSSQQSIATGSANIGVGSQAQQSLTGGSFNVGVGLRVQQFLTTGMSNTAVGLDAQSSFGRQTTTAGQQTSVGANSGQSSATQVNGITTIGANSQAGAENATAIGTGARSDFANSVALGSNSGATAVDQVMIGGRDLEVTSATKGVVLKSPNGTRYRVKVSDAGALTVTAA